jgi:hypothetical protein
MNSNGNGKRKGKGFNAKGAKGATVREEEQAMATAIASGEDLIASLSIPSAAKAALIWFALRRD